jgi:hypothetical protein
MVRIRSVVALYGALLATSCHLVGDVHDRTFVDDGGCSSATDCPASECQTASCSGGLCSATNLASKQSCSSGVCDGAGSCVACLDNDDCPSGPCQNRLCVAAQCVNGTQDGSETDLDCGGGCAPCGSGAGCVLPSDCASGVCQSFACGDCTENDACGEDAYCDKDAGECVPRKPLNAPCEENDECLEPYECKDTNVCDD